MSIEDTLARAFTARRFQLWLVGGALRDGELGRPSPDRDYATDALPDQIEEIAAAIGVRTVNVGRRFGTIGMSVGDRWVEVTTFRGESYRDGTRWPDVTFGTSIDEDLSRRDFTMNALARNVTTGEVLDPFDGRADIHEGIIRCVGDPVRRFREDPLRILRAARFVSQLDFGLDPETAAGMANTAARMS
ncbi:MAG: CCA tRNA nucleotidyltransferase, partial [Dehalococcoidia bacterium]